MPGRKKKERRMKDSEDVMPLQEEKDLRQILFALCLSGQNSVTWLSLTGEVLGGAGE
jgi:hypothetical protein